MPSPFPGMDPYLEVSGLFKDFHHTFIGCWRDSLNSVLPDTYEARIGEDYYLLHEDLDVEPPLVRKRIEPDGAILQRHSDPTSTSAENVATIEPVTVPLVYQDPARQSFVEILHRSDRELVTVFELLSPSNKDSRGRALYDEKRQSILLQPVHLVELDLLFHGQRMTFARRLPPGDYYAMVSRSEKRPLCDVYAWSVRQRLPQIPIPLKQPDPDVTLDLQEVFETTFERGRYARSIDYTVDFTENVAPETRVWIEQRARNSESSPDSSKTPPND